MEDGKGKREKLGGREGKRREEMKGKKGECMGYAIAAVSFVLRATAWMSCQCVRLQR